MAVPIEEFLVSLGFKIDEGQHRRFVDAMSHSEGLIGKFSRGMLGILEQFSKLAVAATGAAVGVTTALIKIGEHMAGVSREAAQLGTSASNLDAFKNTMNELVGSSADAQALLSNLTQKEIANPHWIQQFGAAIDPQLDRVQQLIKLGEHWAQMEKSGSGWLAKYQATQIAGFNLQQYQELTNPQLARNMATELSRQHQQGLNFDFMGRTGQSIQQHVGEIRGIFNGFVEYLFQQFGPRVDEGLQVLVTWLHENTPLIKSYIDRIIDFLSGLPAWVQQHWPEISADFEAVKRTMIGWYDWLKEHWPEIIADLVSAKDSIVAAAASIQAMIVKLREFDRDYLEPIAKKLGFQNTFTAAFEGLVVYLIGARFLGAMGKLSPLFRLLMLAGAVAGVAHAAGSDLPADLGNPKQPSGGSGWWGNQPTVGGRAKGFLGWAGGIASGIGGWLTSPFHIPGMGGGSDQPGGGADGATVQPQGFLGGGGGDLRGMIHPAAFRPISPPSEDKAGAESFLSRLEAYASLPAGLLDKVWAQESGRSLGGGITSSAGAVGPFQFMPGTARRFGIDPTNFQQAAMGAAAYLKQLIGQFGGDLVAGVASYNWGPGNVAAAMKRWGAEWLGHAPAETQNYVRRIVGGYAMSPTFARSSVSNSNSLDNRSTITINGVSDPSRAAVHVRDVMERRDAASRHFVRSIVM